MEDMTAVPPTSASLAAVAALPGGQPPQRPERRSLEDEGEDDDRENRPADDVSLEADRATGAAPSPIARYIL
jgi:hypothetical protein